MKYTFTALALAALSFANPVPDTSVAPPTFKIKSLTYGGTGCPQGSLDIDWNDNRFLPIYFDKQFTAAVGDGADVTDARKDCQINFDIGFSSGYSFAILSTDYVGWGALQSGVTGLVRSTYYFSGDTDEVVTDMTIPGPFYGKYTKHDDVGLLVWSPCGGDALFNIKNAISLTPVGTNMDGALVATHEDAQFCSTLNFLWRKC